VVSSIRRTSGAAVPTNTLNRILDPKTSLNPGKSIGELNKRSAFSYQPSAKKEQVSAISSKIFLWDVIWHQTKSSQEFAIESFLLKADG
jgi:hypothetical protein